jgi:hypothetical protein
MSEDTLETRRVTDLAYRRCFPCCCCYGSIIIEQGSERPKEIISTWHTHGVYLKLKEAVSLAKANTVIADN